MQKDSEKEGSEKNSQDRKCGRLRGGFVSCPLEASGAVRERKKLPQSRDEVTPFDVHRAVTTVVAAFECARKLGGDISLA